tara:strand:- start:981 stop:1358 length:378 start_codon:yes stop_codon:yes gene_type:complete
MAMAITNNQILEELELLKKKLPNGEFALLKKSVEDMVKNHEELKLDIRELKKQLLDPEDGVIVRVNRNSEFRRDSEKRGPLCEKSFQTMEESVHDIVSWKGNVSKALWILFTAVVGLLIKLIMGS